MLAKPRERCLPDCEHKANRPGTQPTSAGLRRRVGFEMFRETTFC